MNTITKSLIGLIAFTALAVSCAKIDDLSNYNAIKGLEIISHTPAAMELSGAQIEADIIYIDIDFGEYLFPLRFHATPIFDDNIDRIIGIDFSQELTFETLDSELLFFVMAPSGLTRRYTLKPRVSPLDKNVALSRFFIIKEQEPSDMLISEEGVTISLTENGERRDTLKIFTVNGSYPLTIRPEFNIAETSRFGDILSPDGAVQPFNNGNTPLLFESADAAFKLQVISESGLENSWNIVVRHALSVSGSDDASTPEEREGSDINPRTITAVPKGNATFVIDEIFVNNITENILLILKKSGAEITFPLEVQVQFPTLNGVQLIGLVQSEIITFDNWDDEKTFYLLDTESCVSRLWKIKLKEWKASDKEVLSFNYTYTAAQVLVGLQMRPCITLDLTQTTINPFTGDIYLCMTAVNNGLISSSWKLTLNNLQIAVSDGATLEPLPAFEWNGNNSWQMPISFKVIAQDGTEKIWRVNVRDMRNYTPSDGCELTGLTIVRHTPNFAVFDIYEPITIDAAERIVTLKLYDDDGVYPLSVWVQCDISPFARITSQDGGTAPLIFDDENSEQIITIIAEDETTSSDWTIRLQPPPREAQAKVETFRVTSVSQGVQLDQVTINDEKGSIRLIVYNAVDFPLEVTYVMTISKKATASIPLRGTFMVNSYTDIQSFVVTAEDGSTRNWNVRLVYEPQLTNWILDVWSNLSGYREPVGWATANNSFVTGTTEVAGSPASGSAAQMRTSSPPIINSIASGSLFLGSFDRTNVLAGMSDPNRLTFFGIPFATSGKILGMEFDAIYLPGSLYINGTDRELASSTIELVKPKQGQENATFCYHGLKSDGTPHPDNTAEAVARAKVELGNSPGTAWNGADITVISNTNWTKVQVLFNYPSGQMPSFTHLHIVFSSSAQGDSFRGVVGSTLRVDNIKILYEED